MRTDLFGQIYDAPFGIAPVGLQGLTWPNPPEILSKAEFDHNISFILSTVSISSIERISEITERKAWFQLYQPAEDSLRDKIIKRASEHCPVLVILRDVPSFGYRSKEIKNGLAMPPRMTVNNILTDNGKAKLGDQNADSRAAFIPGVKTIHAKRNEHASLGLFMNKTFDGRLNEEKGHSKGARFRLRIYHPRKIIYVWHCCPGKEVIILLVF